MTVADRNSVFYPKRPRWMVASLVIWFGLMAAYLFASLRAPWAPGHVGGLVAGSAAAGLFVSAALYPLRRRIHAWPFGTSQRWLQFHLYGSVVGAILALIHIGFRLPGGALGWWLLGMTMWTAVSGLLGVYVQKALPLVLARNFQVEALYDRIPEIVEKLASDADKVMTGASALVDRTYQAEVRPMLESVRPSWTFLMNPRGGRDRQLEPLVRLRTLLADADREKLVDLETIVRDKLDLDAHASIQLALRWWVVSHVPPALLLIGLLIVHFTAVVTF